MNSDGKTFYRLTTYNVIAAVAVSILNTPPFIYQIVQTTSLLIGVTVFIVIAYLPYESIRKFYKQIFPAIAEYPVAVHAHNALLHFVPILVLGLPPSGFSISVCVGYGIYLSWYLALRRNDFVRKVYIREIDVPTYDKLIATSCIITFAILYLNYH